MSVNATGVNIYLLFYFYFYLHVLLHSFTVHKCNSFRSYSIRVLLRGDIMDIIVVWVVGDNPRLVAASANVHGLRVMRSASALDVAERIRFTIDERPNNIFSSHVALNGISAIIWQRLSDRARFDHSSCNGEGEID